jgi:hypothetical protein
VTLDFLEEQLADIEKRLEVLMKVTAESPPSPAGGHSSWPRPSSVPAAAYPRAFTKCR